MLARMEAMGRTALVTGASAGLGLAFAEVLAARGFNLILSARRLDRLEAAATALRMSRRVKVTVIPADLADPEAPGELVAAIAARGLTVDMLVNNAGYGIPATFEDSAWEAQRDQMQVLMNAPAELVHRLLPGMLERGWGRIINVASLAAFAPAVPGATLYAGAKSFVVRFSEFLAAEVAGRGVNVLATCPGFTRTDFHETAAMSTVARAIPDWQWQSADAVAREAVDAVMDGRGPVLVNGFINRVGAFLLKYLPAWLIRVIAARHPLGRRAQAE